MSGSVAVTAAIAVLEEHGFVADGATHEETVRIPTARSPLFGKGGGELRTFGGRARYRHPSGWFATVGPRKICLYRRDEPSGVKIIATRQTEELREALGERLNLTAEIQEGIVGADNSDTSVLQEEGHESEPHTTTE